MRPLDNNGVTEIISSALLLSMAIVTISLLWHPVLSVVENIVPERMNVNILASMNDDCVLISHHGGEPIYNMTVFWNNTVVKQLPDFYIGNVTKIPLSGDGALMVVGNKDDSLHRHTLLFAEIRR